MTKETELPATIYLTAHSLRGFALAIQEYVSQGYKIDMSNEGCPRPFINMFVTRLTLNEQEECPIKDWSIQPVVEAIPLAKEIVQDEKRKPGRPKLSLNQES